MTLRSRSNKGKVPLKCVVAEGVIALHFINQGEGRRVIYVLCHDLCTIICS